MATRRLCLLLLIGCWIFCVTAGRALPASRVAVVDCPTAVSWLRAVGVECDAIPADGLSSTPLTVLQLLVLPLDRLKGEAALRSVSSFAMRGGMVVAVYWGA